MSFLKFLISLDPGTFSEMPSAAVRGPMINQLACSALREVPRFPPFFFFFFERFGSCS